MDTSSSRVTPATYWNGVRKLMALWAAIIFVGFLFTYFYQTLNPTSINIVWGILAAIGLIYSKKQMPWSDVVLRNIFLVWLIIIVLGLTLSQIIFILPPLYYYASLLGAVWLMIMALGHTLTGFIDKKKIYILTAGLQLVVAFLIFAFVNSIPSLYTLQYLIAGIVGAASMMLLLIFI